MASIGKNMHGRSFGSQHHEQYVKIPNESSPYETFTFTFGKSNSFVIIGAYCS